MIRSRTRRRSTLQRRTVYVGDETGSVKTWFFKVRKFATVFMIMFIFFSAASLLLPQFRDTLHKAAGVFGVNATTERVDHGLPEKVFSDVTSSHPHAEALFYLKSHGMIQGYQDGSFKPDNTLTRAEFSKFLVSSKGAIPHVIRHSYCFDDVQMEWFAPYVCFAKDHGWVGGITEKTFAPNDEITAEQAQIMLEKAFDTTSGFHGSANGNGKFTRAEAAEMIATVSKQVK